MRLERDLSKWLRERIESAGGYCIKHHGSAYARAGVPDHHITHRDWTGYVELKRHNRIVTDIQRIQMRKIVAAGGRALVLRLDKSGGSVWVEDHSGETLCGLSTKTTSGRELIHILRGAS